MSSPVVLEVHVYSGQISKLWRSFPQIISIAAPTCVNSVDQCLSSAAGGTRINLRDPPSGQVKWSFYHNRPVDDSHWCGSLMSSVNLLHLSVNHEGAAETLELLH